MQYNLISYNKYQPNAFTYSSTGLSKAIEQDEFKSLIIILINLPYYDLTNAAAIDRTTYNFYKLERARRLDEGSLKFSEKISKNFNSIINNPFNRFINLSRVDCPKWIEISSLNCLGSLTNLTHLSLQGAVASFENEELCHLEGLRNLTYLNLQGVVKRDAQLLSLKQLVNLTHLNLQGTDMTNDGLYCLQTSTNLTHLNLQGALTSDEGLCYLAKLTNLTHLNLQDTFTTEEGLCYLNTLLTNLTYLNLQGTDFKNLTENSRDKIINLLFPTLTTLLFTNIINLVLKHLPHDSLTNASQINKEIYNFYKQERTRRINEGSLKFSERIKEHFNEIVSTHFTPLSRLVFPKGVKISSLECLGNLTNLTHLSLQGAADSFEKVQLWNLRNLKNLTYLNFQGTPITDEGLSWLRKLKNLTHLDLQDCKKITSSGVFHLLEKKNFIDLNLTGCFEEEISEARKTDSVNKQAIERIFQLASEKSHLLFPIILEFVQTYLPYKDLIHTVTNKRTYSFYKSQRSRRLYEGSLVFSDKTSGDFSNIINKNFPQLSRLKCPKEVNDSAFAIKHLTNLTSLDLSNSIYNPELNGLASLTNLTYLNLSGSGISNAKLNSLETLTNLTYLNLSHCKITAGLNSLATLTNLTYLNLATNGITNAELDSLKTLTKLTSLNLRMSLISDEGLLKLVPITNLFHLNLEGLTLSENFLIALVKGLSNLGELFVRADPCVSFNDIKYYRDIIAGKKERSVSELILR